jgi:hypothetical protein
MEGSRKASWDQVESILSMDGVVEVQWEYPLVVIIHRDIRNQVSATLSQNGYEGEITFADFPDDIDAVIDHQAQHLNNFDLYFMPGTHRPDLGDFPHFEGWDKERPLWEAADQVLAEHQLTHQQIRDLHERASADVDDDVYDFPEYRDIMVSMFRALRKRGYSARELTG